MSRSATIHGRGPRMEALLRPAQGAWLLCSPSVGRVQLELWPGQLLEPNASIGVFEQLGRPHRLYNPATKALLCERLLVERNAPVAVDFAHPLALLRAASDAPAPALEERLDTVPSTQAQGGIALSRDADALDRWAERENVQMIRAPIGGLFFRAAQPGATPFVAPGCTLAAEQSLGVIELMKLFFTVRWQPPPDEARNFELLSIVDDATVVTAGQVIATARALCA